MTQGQLHLQCLVDQIIHYNSLDNQIEIADNRTRPCNVVGDSAGIWNSFTKERQDKITAIVDANIDGKSAVKACVKALRATDLLDVEKGKKPISDSWVARFVAARKVVVPRKTQAEVNDILIMGLYDKGLTMSEIIKQSGLSGTGARFILERNGVRYCAKAKAYIRKKDSVD